MYGTGVRNSVLPMLAAAALLVGFGAPNPSAVCTSRHADSACVRDLTAAESAALARAVARLDAVDRGECRALATFIREHEGEARVLPYPIATPYGTATGDAHVVEHPTGTGRVHVADSVLTRQGALARPMDAKVRTLMHDFAHLALDLPQFTFHLTSDAADDALARCLER